jgi:hypothetical protein
MRPATILTAAGVLAIVIAISICAGAQAPRGALSTVPSTTSTLRVPSLPPLLQTCPMHPDIIEDAPGTCPLCRMALVPVRLESVWSCPLHAAVAQSAKGTCPICGRELVQMTMALTWTCKGRPDIDVIEPGRCPDGSAMVPKRTLRPHGNHNPQHGGQFFMAPDNTHHLEGTLPSPQLFRVYLYDDYARPLPADRLKNVSGHVDIGGRSIPLTPVTTNSSLEARLDAVSLPARMMAKLQIKADGPEYRFDFAFPSVTKDPNAAIVAETPARSIDRPELVPLATATPNVTPPPGPAVAAKPAAQAPDAPSAPTIDPALIQVPIPGTVPEILAQMRIRDRQVRELIDRGNLPAVFVPAFQARDLAIALEARLETLPASTRDGAASAIVQLVRAAWMLDASGDVGNREQATAASDVLHQAATTIATAFSGSR